jgi:hypothetical protein
MNNIYKTQDILDKLKSIPEPDYKQAIFIFDKMMRTLSIYKDYGVNLTHAYWRALPRGFNTCNYEYYLDNKDSLEVVNHDRIVSPIGSPHLQVLVYTRPPSLKNIDPNSEYVSLTEQEVNYINSIGEKA